MGGLEEGIVLAERRRDKEGEGQGGMQGEHVKYVSAGGMLGKRAAEQGEAAELGGRM